MWRFEYALFHIFHPTYIVSYLCKRKVAATVVLGPFLWTVKTAKEGEVTNNAGCPVTLLTCVITAKMLRAK